MTKAPTIRSMRRIALMALPAIILLVFGFYAWLNSRYGTAWLSGTVFKSTRGSVQLVDLQGRIPFHMHASEVILRDRDAKTWLTGRDVGIRLRTRGLLRGRIDVVTATATRVQLHDLPRRDDRTEKEAKRTVGFFRGLSVRLFTVDELVVSSNATHVAFDGRASGSLHWTALDGMGITVNADAIANSNIHLSATSEIRVQDNVVTLERLAVSNKYDRAAASGVFRISDGQFHLAVDGALEAVEDYVTITTLPQLSGQIAGRIMIEMAGRDEIATISGNMESPRFGWRDLHFREVSATGRVDVSRSRFIYHVDASVESATSGAFDIHSLHYAGDGSPFGHAAKVDFIGNAGSNDEFAASGNVNLRIDSTNGVLLFTAPDIDVGWNALVFSVQDASMDIHSNGVIRVSLPSVLLNGSSLSVVSTITSGVVDQIDLSARDIDLRQFRSIWPETVAPVNGHAAIALSIRDGAAEPSGQADIKLTDVTFGSGFLQHFAGSSLTVTSAMHDGFATVAVQAVHPLIETCELSATIPLRHSPGIVPFARDTTSPVNCNIRMDAELADIGATLIDGATGISGRFELGMKIFDALGLPRYTGSATLRDGQYRNIQTGTFLDEVNVSVVGTENAIAIESATATDGGIGKLSARGQVRMTSDFRNEANLIVTLTNATVFRLIRTDLPLSGDITLVSTGSTMQVAGALWLEPFRFNIPRKLPPSIPTLDVVEINHRDPARNTTAASGNQQASKPAANKHMPQLDIAVKTRDSFIVSGRGLYSVWKGAMNLRGSDGIMRLDGNAEVRQGYVMLLGRRFQIDDGRIQLTGDIPPNPLIRVSASTRIGDTVAIMNFGGTVKRPEMVLTSEPSLPKDEVMALILFGKTVDSMSPMQAVVLANGLQLLSGSGDVADLIDRSQSIVQIDQLDIKQDTEGNGFSSVSVGKYIGDRFYVEGEKGFGEAADTVTVVIELSPRLTLETESSPRIREGVSLHWRREY